MKCPICGSEMSSMRLEVDYYEWYCPQCDHGSDDRDDEADLERWPGEFEDGSGVAWHPEEGRDGDED